MIHVVALSGGKDSSAMALRLAELNPTVDYTYICTPTGDELPEMFDHWKNLGVLLGKPIKPVMYRTGLNGLIAEQDALPNWRQRWCTRILKIEPYRDYLLNHTPAVSYVGLRADEPDREGGDYADVPNVEMRFPMREWGWKIRDVLEYLEKRGVKVPPRTDCARCFYQKLGEWKDLFERYPDIYQTAVDQEKAIGHTFRSPGRDTWPADLESLREEFKKGRVIRGENKQQDLFGITKCRVCRI